MSSNVEIKRLPSFRFMGMRKEVSFSDVNSLYEVIEKSREVVHKLEHAIHPEHLIGISFHTIKNGFVYYSGCEVSTEQSLLDGLEELSFPEQDYLLTTHKGESIVATYEEITEWLENSDYTPLMEEGMYYYDNLPIKIEKHVYPTSDLLKYDILIPVEKK